MADSIEFDKKREINEIIDDSYLFIKRHFRELMWLMTTTIFPFLLVFQAVTQKITPEVAKESSFASAGSLLLLLSGQAMMLTTVYGFLFSKMFGTAFSRDELWSILRNNFLMMLSTVSSSVILIILGMFAFIVPGVFIAVPLSFVYIHKLRTGDTFFGCLTYLFELVKGYWWNSFAVILISGIVIFGIGAIALIPHFFWGLYSQEVSIETSVISAFSNVLFYMITTFTAVPITMQYFNLKHRKGC